MLLRTGIDLIEIARLENLDEKIKPRFLKRVFTQAELEEVGANSASLAGRFAVKEAVAKALGTGIGEISWQEIEVHRGPLGEPLLELHGNALRMAEQLCLGDWSISISHTHTHAVALAVALGKEPSGTVDP
jgi:holo-[acyl-carrier protein] synthase